jgi:hypothetical protein
VAHSPNHDLARAFVNKLSTGEKQVGRKKRQLEQAKEDTLKRQRKDVQKEI